MSDRFGRKAIVIISLIGQCIAFLWLAEAGSIMEIYYFRAVAGLFVGSIPALFASMTEPPSPRSERALWAVSAALSLRVSRSDRSLVEFLPRRFPWNEISSFPSQLPRFCMGCSRSPRLSLCGKVAHARLDSPSPTCRSR
jgi:hypothetical protein